MGTQWQSETITLTGDLLDEHGAVLTDQFELWFRNPLCIIKELISNPAFNGFVSYTPERVYDDDTGETRVYDEMWTADWWWDMQVS